MSLLRKPTEQFTLDFITFYLKHRENDSEISALLEGFQRKGIDMREFYWMEPELKPSDSEIKHLLKLNPYNFSEEKINDIFNRANYVGLESR
ncbi:MAG TPA: hypothetical protein VHA12_03700 [Candidatus Nanoarchaeia archaeon]|nr:hypothetical protein [Candidatus Nanoarchaeia archaeon]